MSDPNTAPNVADLDRGENDQHYNDRNDANRRQVTDDWHRANKAVPIAVGQIILFAPGAHETVMTSDQPMAAIVTYVRDDGLVNCAVFGKNGDMWAKQSIKLLADGEAFPERGSHAYLVGSKHATAKEAADAKAAAEAKKTATTALPPVSDIPRLPGESDADYKTRNDANRKRQADDWNRTHPKTSETASTAPKTWEGDAYAGNPSPGGAPRFPSRSGLNDPLVSPPVGPEYHPNAPRSAPYAPEPIDRVPASSPANPARPLD